MRPNGGGNQGRQPAARSKAVALTGPSKRPAAPPGAKNWQGSPAQRASSKKLAGAFAGAPKPKARSKSSDAFKNVPAYQKDLFMRLDRNQDGMISAQEWATGMQSLTNRERLEEAGTRAQGPARMGTRDDPLNLKEPPQGRAWADPSELIMDGDYLGAGLNPDSLLADVEALLAQERMLAEQSQWWEERTHRELATRQRMQAEMQAQEAAFKQEVMAMQREIANCREEQSQEEARAEASVNEASGLREEASVAAEQIEGLRRGLEQVAVAGTPRSAARVRQSLARASFSTAPSKASRAPFSQATTSPSMGRSPGQRASTPMSMQSNAVVDVGPSISVSRASNVLPLAPRSNLPKGMQSVAANQDFYADDFATIRVAPSTGGARPGMIQTQTVGPGRGLNAASAGRPDTVPAMRGGETEGLFGSLDLEDSLDMNDLGFN